MLHGVVTLSNKKAGILYVIIKSHGDIIMSKASFIQTGHFPFLVLNTAPQSEHATMSPGLNIISYQLSYYKLGI
jgi:hypothetical protein